VQFIVILQYKEMENMKKFYYDDFDFICLYFSVQIYCIYVLYLLLKVKENFNYSEY
jgi:hypothetical protein